MWFVTYYVVLNECNNLDFFVYAIWAWEYYKTHLVWQPKFSLSYRGALIGHPVENLRVVLTDGAAHAVDSSELAFKLASIYAFRQVLFVSVIHVL